MLFTYNVIACSGTISYFIPTLMKSLGYKNRNAQFMTVPIYAVALVMSLSGGYIADKTQQKAFVIAGAGTLATIAYVICTVVQNPKVKYAMICFGAGGVWTVIPIFLSWVVIMFDGREKRAVAIAAINGFGNLSSIWGSFFWPKEQAPKYVMGFAITCALCASAVVVVLFTKWRFGDRGVERTA
jgi:predicted MFS family arabinose efflux permease